MAVQNITQLRRVVIRKWTGAAWSVMTLEADDLGQDTTATINVAPRLRSRASAMGSTEHPIEGTFNGLAGSITFLLDTWKPLGKALGKWADATYAGHSTTAGQVLFGEGTVDCDGDYVSVVLQGLCDNGSEADVELTRCQPSVDDDIEIGTSETPSVTLNLHPIIYNAALHSGDGYGTYTVRFGEYDLTAKKRLNATTGAYDAVSE